MSDSVSGAQKYTGNSNRDKQNDEIPEKKVEKVIEGSAIQRKTPLSRRIAQSFTGADARSVGQYVMFEVVLPQLKDLIYDVGSSALQRSLFGDRGGKASYTSSSRRTGYTPYNAMSTSAVNKVQQAVKPISPSSEEFGEIIVESRGEAQEVMDKISNLVESYGMASVSDLKAAVGITGTFTDEKFGWIGMGGTDIRRVGGAQPGYLLIFPRPEELP